MSDLTIADGKWMMFEVIEMATYTLIFSNAPNYSITEAQLYRTIERNLAGEILSEFRTTKGKIHMDFGQTNSLSASEKNQVLRYYGMNNLDIYLACAPISADGVNYYRNIWKVFFVNEPACTPLDGNETRFVMTLELEER
jgi:hypothetical protein